MMNREDARHLVNSVRCLFTVLSDWGTRDAVRARNQADRRAAQRAHDQCVARVSPFLYPVLAQVAVHYLGFHADLPTQDDVWSLFAGAQITVPLAARQCSAENISELLAWIRACNLEPYLRAHRLRCHCLWCWAPDPDSPWFDLRHLNMDFDGDEMNGFVSPADGALRSMQRALSAALRTLVTRSAAGTT